MSKPSLDIAGRRFGMLVAECDTGVRAAGNKSKWWCVCNCGRRIAIDKGNLVRGHTQTCGCIKLGKRANLTGWKFGKLTALNDMGRTENGQRIWLCSCECGPASYTQVRSAALTSGNTRSCGCLVFEAAGRPPGKLKGSNPRCP